MANIIARAVEVDYRQLPPLHWTWWNDGTVEDPQWVPAMACSFGHVFRIERNHTVDQNGNVNPSMVCPYKCSYHSYIKLEMDIEDFVRMSRPPRL